MRVAILLALGALGLGLGAVGLSMAGPWLSKNAAGDASDRLMIRAAPAGDPHRTVPLYVPAGSEALADLFARLGYRLRQVHSGAKDVPRVFVSSLPDDLESIPEVEQRKALFIRSVLPLVLKENERLGAARTRLNTLTPVLRRGGGLGDEDAAWLAALYDRYGVTPGDLERLRRRVDVVPPSLAVAQAIMESGWGTSRFVREGNALFGMWTWSPDTAGLVPQERPPGKSHRVRSFETLQDAVRAYMHTLNTHYAYHDFRLGRAHLRAKGQALTGLVLVNGLLRYSTERRAYIRRLRTVIQSNDLDKLDHSRLSSDGLAGVSSGPFWLAGRVTALLKAYGLGT